MSASLGPATDTRPRGG